jgi:TetR/AcrR family transcriptional regulator, mexJK operon transcriptional repressor
LATADPARTTTAPPENAARRRGRPSPEETEEITRSILTAAMAIFSEQSFNDASIEAIAARAGVKKDTIYKRYADKRALLRAALGKRLADWSRTQGVVFSGDTLEQRLKSYAVHLLRQATSEEGRIWIGLVHSAWQGLEGRNERHSAIGYHHAVRLIASELRDATARDQAPARNPEMVATALMAMLAGWTDAVVPSTSVSEGEIIRFAETAIDLIIYGRSAW